MERKELKLRVIETAKEIFISKGFKHLKMDELSKELGISKRTVYELFDSKEQLVSEIIQNRINDLHGKILVIIEKLENDDEYDFAYALNQILELQIETYTDFFKPTVLKDIKIYLRSHWSDIIELDNKTRDIFRKLFNNGVNRNLIKKNVNSEIFHQVFFAATHRILEPDVLAKVPLTALEAFREVFTILFTGVATETGRNNMQKHF